MPEPTLRLSCTYVWTSNLITAKATITITPIDPDETITIPNDFHIVLIFPLRSTYGLNSFGTNQPMTISVQVPTKDLAKSVSRVYGDTFSTPPALVEECSNPDGLNLQNTVLEKSFYL